MTVRTLVTGASGFIGRNLMDAAAYERSGQRWWCVDRAGAPRPALVPEGTEFLDVDLTSRSAVRELVSAVRPTRVVHLAGVTSKAETDELCERLFRANLMSTCLLLESLREFCPSESERPRTHFVVLSTGLVYGSQPSPFQEDMVTLPPDAYGLSKLLAEQAVLAFERQQAVDACVMRPAIVYGPGQRSDMFLPALLGALHRGQHFPMTAGEQTRDFVHVSDVVHAILLALDGHLVGTFNIGSGAPTSIRRVGELASQLAGKSELLGLGEVPYRRGEVWDYALDSRRMRAAGWKAETGLIEGIRSCIEDNAGAGQREREPLAVRER